MAKGISLSYIVDITSTGVRDIFSLSKLPSLFLSEFNSANPRNKFEEFGNANQVLTAYGADSNAYKFALNYFGFTSKMATKADRLTIYNWNKQGSGAILQGAKLEKSVSELAGLNGVIGVNLGGSVENVAVNFENSTSYSEIANILQTAIQAVGIETDNTDPENPITNITNPSFANAQVFFNVNTGGFIVVSGETGENSKIGYFSDGIVVDLGLAEANGGIIINGENGKENLAEALAEVETENGAYFNICFDKTLNLTDADILTIGKWVNATNCRYMASVILDNPKWKNQRDMIGDLKGYNGLSLEFRVSDDQDGLTAGIISSKDFSTINGNFGYAFNQCDEFSESSVKLESELDNLESNLINSIATFGSMGQFVTSTYGDFVCGDITNSNTIYEANAFLVLSEQMAIMNMFLNEPLVGLRGANNQGKFYSVIDSEMQKGVRNGTIICLQSKDDLTTTEKNKIMSVFGENGATALNAIWKNGYYFIIDGVDLVERKIHISQAYIGNGQTKKVVIANYILGA